LAQEALTPTGINHQRSSASREQGGGGLLGSLCRRRRQQVEVRELERASACPEDGNEAAQPQDIPLLPAGKAPQFGPCRVTKGTGCIWFAGSDDRQGEWCFQSACANEPSPGGWHGLYGGPPWASDEVGLGGNGDGTGPGERRVELRLQLLHLGGDRARAQEEGARTDAEAFSQAEALLRAELEACLLTRSEAAALEAGDQSVRDDLEVEQWEAIRAGLFDGSPMLRWSPVLSAFQAVLNLVSAIPGSKKLASVGEALERRARTILNGPEGAGHEHEKEHEPTGQEQCQPCQ